MSDQDKPVYDEAQIITALTTQDGTHPSLAWSTDIITFSIDTGQIDPTNPEYTDEMSGYVAMTDGKVAAAREAFALYDDLIAVDLLETTDWPSAHITINESSNTGNETYTAFSYWLVDNDPRSEYKLADADIWLADDGVNIIHGGGGADVIRGGGGNDILEGNGGADIFVCGVGDDTDRIDRFNLLDDLIHFDSVASGFGDLTITGFNGDAAVTYGVGDVILLTGIDSGLLTADQFEFV